MENKSLVSKLLHFGLVPGSIVSFVRDKRNENKGNERSLSSSFEDYSVAVGLEAGRLASYGYVAYCAYRHFQA